MEQNEIDYYLYHVLKKQLQKMKLSNYGLYSILNQVKLQLNSIIKHWNDPDFLNTIFLTVIEEGQFYEPSDVDLKVRNLVVLGIRNSPLETAASVDYKKFGLKNSLNDDVIQAITRSAIEYFKEIDLEKLSGEIMLEQDYYDETLSKYSYAYQALSELGKCSSNPLEKEFTPFQCEPYEIKEITMVSSSKTIQCVTEVTSGISDDLDQGLLMILNQILENQTQFLYIDSFKYLSRNFEKNLKILEFVLTHQAFFLTNNFLLHNGYVSRREPLIRAHHGRGVNREALMTIGEVSRKYQKVLEELFEMEESHSTCY